MKHIWMRKENFLLHKHSPWSIPMEPILRLEKKSEPLVTVSGKKAQAKRRKTKIDKTADKTFISCLFLRAKAICEMRPYLSGKGDCPSQQHRFRICFGYHPALYQERQAFRMPAPFHSPQLHLSQRG